MAGYAGYALGAIRAAATLVGLLISTVLAFPLGKLLHGLLATCGIKNPFFIYLLAPVIVFLILLTVFKAIGFSVHHKVDHYYKHKAGDLRMGLFERLNHRVGACIGVVNAAIYLILLCLPIYVFSYATVQVADDNASWSMKMLNTLGHHVRASGMAKIDAAIDPLPETYYQTSDLMGLVYHNDLLESRLSRYPAFLMLGEKAEFQDIGNDKEFTELRLKQPSISEIVNHPKAQAILGNPDMLKEIWGILVPNITDLDNFLKTGQSAKYGDQKLLGRWDFNLNGALALMKQSNPNYGSTEMQKRRRVLFLTMAKTVLIAAPDKQVIVKDVGELHANTNPKLAPTVSMQKLEGQWEGDGSKYTITISSPKKQTFTAEIQGERMTVTGGDLLMSFEHEM
ncbi:CvpA family protein [Pedosphaera parvula]